MGLGRLPPRLSGGHRPLGGLAAIGGEAWLWILVTGALLAGYVATWFAALRRAQATIVTSVLVLAAVVTGALSAAVEGQHARPGSCSGATSSSSPASRSSVPSAPSVGPVPCSSRRRRRVSRGGRAASGPVLFARYAYGPNRLGLCGPDDAESLFGETTTTATIASSASSPAGSRAPTRTWS